MNDRIMVGFRNDKGLRYSEVISAKRFPVEGIYHDKHHTYAVLDTENTEIFGNYIEALSEYIINRYEGKILKRIISLNYPEIPNMEISEIIKLKDEQKDDERRKILTDILFDYFSENSSGSVEGILNFRLEKYKNHLATLADEIVDIYYLNREYEDFIELLRYFISVQEMRSQMIYIVVNENGMYTILDAERTDITQKALSEIVTTNEAKSLAYEDLLISVLISIAPKKIIVENRENIKNEQIFETVEKVFESVEYRN